MKTLTYRVLFSKEIEGGYTAIVPSLARCVAGGIGSPHIIYLGSAIRGCSDKWHTFSIGYFIFNDNFIFINYL